MSRFVVDVVALVVDVFGLAFAVDIENKYII